MNRKVFITMILALFAVSLVAIVSALPVGPETLNLVQSQRWDTLQSLSTDAYAGNVTMVNFTGTTITRTWQGYYGNVTGRIVLGDANNNTLYDWFLAEPQGEIYAVRDPTVPAWSSVVCANPTELQAEDTAIGVDATIDEDAVNRTFLDSVTHPIFYVGSVEILADACYGLELYDDNGVSSQYYKEVMLSDTSANMIYTAILSRTMDPLVEHNGFDGVPYDFQMIVGENGHGTNTAVSTYYFYLEIE